MSFNQPKAPAPPDPAATAAAQTSTNISTALANNRMAMVDQVGPNGSVTNQVIGYQTITDPTTGTEYKVPRYKQTTNLTPQGRMANDANQQTQTILARTGTNVARNLEGHLGGGFNLDGLPNAGAQRANMERIAGGVNTGAGLQDGVNIDTSRVNPGEVTRSYGDPEGYATQRQRVEDALMSRINPSLQRDQEALRTSLLNQGVREGTEAFDRAMNRFGEQSNDARMQAILAGGTEQTRLAGLDRDRASFENQATGQDFTQNLTAQSAQNAAMGQLFGTNLSAAGFQNQAQQQQFGQAGQLYGMQEDARQRAIQERLLERNQPINEVSALLSGSQVQSPQFGPTPQYGNMPTVDYAGLVNANYGQQMNAYNQQMQGRNAMMGSLFGLAGNLGGAGIMAY